MSKAVKYSQGNRLNYNIEKWLCDSLDDVKTIRCRTFGSTVYVIDEKESFILDSSGTWKSMRRTDLPDIPSCDCVEELTIWGDIADDGTITMESE